jgi:hypothetical protein
MIQMSWRSIQRVVTFGFLLFVLLDLTVPGFCRTDEIPVRDSPAATGGAGSSQEPHPGAPDDCFCCCVHINAEPHFVFSQVLTYVERIAPIGTPSTHSDPQLLFHPPRYL